MSKSQVVKKNIVLSMLYKSVSIIISFMLIPITLKYLGNTYYGLWATILSTISWINYFDVGIGNGLRNYLSIEIALKNYKAAREYIVTSYVILSLISLFFLSVLSVILKFVDLNRLLNTTILDGKELFSIFLINIFFIFVNFILKIITSIFYALQKSSVIGLMQALNQLLNLIGVYILYKMKTHNPLFEISLVYGFSMMGVSLFFSIILFLKEKDLRPTINDFSSSKIKDLINLGIKFFIIQIAAVIIFTTDNLIISNLFSPERVTPYNITYKVFTVFVMLNSIIRAPLWSAITAAYAEKDLKWIKTVLNKLNKIFIVFCFFIILVYLAFPIIIKVWIGENLEIPKFLVLNFAVYSILNIFSGKYSTIFNGLGKINLQLIVAIIQGIINIPLSIFLAKHFEISGVIMGTNLTLLISAILFPIGMKRILKDLEKNQVEGSSGPRHN